MLRGNCDKCGRPVNNWTTSDFQKHRASCKEDSGGVIVFVILLAICFLIVLLGVISNRG